MTKQLTIILTAALLAACNGNGKAKDNKSGTATATNADTSTPAFEYRALYTPSNNKPADYGITGTNNADYDWGLWGHNIWKVVGKNAPKDIYATVNGKRDTTQYCFSSDKLYHTIEAWIVDQHGEQPTMRFTVMPADNKKACTCTACKKHGNTEANATPAVEQMVRRLAQRFPKHIFFMTAYHTTMTPPTKPLPDNTGVMVSTMDIPMRYTFQESGGYRKFNATLKAWAKVTPRIYVWEYDRNFDDYLTPYPCLEILRQRFMYYQKAGVKGIFVNGSGYDYSSFDDVQSYVLAQLMRNPKETDIETLVRRFYARFFPKCGEFIADYYLTLEDRVKKSNRVLPYYGTIDEAQEAYLQRDEFISFWTTLDKKSKSVTGSERKRINQMLTAFAYTMLQLKPTQQMAEEYIEILKDYKSVPGLTNYKETDGPLDKFIKKSIAKYEE